MDEILKNIDAEKRDRIINSALEEFSKNRFDKASTNNIVKKANISKGLLYHYFNSKKELFEYLKKFVVKTIVKEIEEKIDWNESDIFNRIKQIVMIKLQTVNRYPYIFTFSSTVFENKSIDEIKKLSDEFSTGLYYQIYNYNIDFSKFKDGIDIQKALTIIRWTFEKYGEESIKIINNCQEEIDYKEIEEEIDQYIEVLRKAFYNS